MKVLCETLQYTVIRNEVVKFGMWAFLCSNFKLRSRRQSQVPQKNLQEKGKTNKYLATKPAVGRALHVLGNFQKVEMIRDS